jgi:DNA-binding transcriptional MerR regulator
VVESEGDSEEHMDNLLPIGRFSVLCRLTVKALRYYDEQGLLKPALVDPDSGYRYYSASQMREAGMIRLLRELDMPVEDVRVVVRTTRPEQAQAYLDRHEKRLQERIQGYQVSLATLRELMRSKEVNVEYEVKLKEMAAQPIATVRMTCTPAEIGPTMGQGLGRVFAHMGRAGVTPAGPPLAIYHRYDEESVDMSVGAPVSRPVPEGEGVVPGELPAGLAAMVVHVGPYQTIGGAWEALTAWNQQHGHESADPCWESYVTDPGANADPSTYVTEVYCMVKG